MPLSSSVLRHGFSSGTSCPIVCRFFAGEYGFATDCVAQCENILSVELSKLDLDRGPRGMLDPTRFRDVIKAIGHVLGSDCEPV